MRRAITATTRATAICLLTAACTHATATPSQPTTDAATTQVLAQTSGTSPGSAAFTATAQWTLTYSFDCRNQPSIEFTITDSDGTPLVTNIAQQQGGGQGPGWAGTHKLTVTSHCVWSITVTQ